MNFFFGGKEDTEMIKIPTRGVDTDALEKKLLREGATCAVSLQMKEVKVTHNEMIFWLYTHAHTHTRHTSKNGRKVLKCQKETERIISGAVS